MYDGKSENTVTGENTDNNSTAFSQKNLDAPRPSRQPVSTGRQGRRSSSRDQQIRSPADTPSNTDKEITLSLFTSSISTEGPPNLRGCSAVRCLNDAKKHRSLVPVRNTEQAHPTIRRSRSQYIRRFSRSLLRKSSA